MNRMKAFCVEQMSTYSHQMKFGITIPKLNVNSKSVHIINRKGYRN